MAFWRARYGDETTPSCPVCGRPAIVRNAQGMPVCTDHRTANLSASCPNCKAELEMRDGKFGKFFLCIKCGPVSMSKVSVQVSSTPQISSATKQPSDKAHPMMGNRRTARAESYKNPDGSDKFVRSDDPRFEFR